MTKKQIRLAIVLGIAFVVLLLTYFIVLRPIINEVIEDMKPPLNLENGEVEGANDRIMLFPQVERASIQSIEVKNSHGTYKFVRNKNNSFDIEGSEGTAYDAELFSTLVTDCGYTLSKVKVANDNPDKLSDYGLDEASNPAYYILTSVEGVSHKVWVGTIIPSNGGYYVRYEGRNTVYVLDSTLETTVLAPIEAFVTPTLIMPTSLTTYYMLDDLAIFRGTFTPKLDEKGDETTGGASATTDKGEDSAGGVTSDKKEQTPIVRFHYLKDEEKAKLDINATFWMDYPGNGAYYASTYVDGVAQQFIAYAGSECVKLAPTDDDLKKYGCLDADYTLYVVNNQAVTDANKKTQYIAIPNFVYFSEMQKDEETGEQFRYAYSVLFDLVAKVPYYDCLFLEYDLNTWVSAQLFNTNINKVSYVTVESGDTNISFTLRGQDSALVVEDNAGHFPEVKNFRKFYQVMLGLMKGGNVSLTEAQCKALTSDEANVTAKLTVKMHSGRELVYRFYSYGVQTYYTVNGEGEFYLPTAQVTKLINDAVRVTRDEVVNPDNAV